MLYSFSDNFLKLSTSLINKNEYYFATIEENGSLYPTLVDLDRIRNYLFSSIDDGFLILSFAIINAVVATYSI
jgi:hypothetical protein